MIINYMTLRSMVILQMAAAGFHFTGSKNEPDLAQCFVCLKELDGWEEDDDPW